MLERLLAGQEEMKAKMKAWRGEMAAMTDKWGNDSHKETVAEPKHEVDRKAEREEFEPKKDTETTACQEMAAQKEEVPVVDAEEEEAQGPKTGRGALPSESEGFDVGKSLTPEEIGRRPQRDNTPCESGTAEGKPRKGE